MKDGKVPRFTPIETAFHWSQAIPYMILFCTGAGMFLQRFLDADFVPGQILSIVHRVSGLVLIFVLSLTLFFSAVWNGFRDLLRRIRNSLS